MSRSGKSCSHCGKPAATKRAIFCERCGSQEFTVTDKKNISKPKTDNKPTRKELEKQFNSLQVEKEKLEEIATETIEKLNKKSVELDRLQRSTDPQALEDFQEQIIEFEYSQYLLKEELACVKIDLSDAEKLSSEVTDKYQQHLADVQQDIAELNYFIDLLLDDLVCIEEKLAYTEEQALEVFDRNRINFIDHAFHEEDGKGGRSTMMKSREKFWGFKKGREIPWWKRIVAIVLSSLGLVTIIAGLILGSVMFNKITNQGQPTPQPTIFSMVRPTPTPSPTMELTPKPTVAPTPTPTPTLTPTPSPTPKPTPEPTPTLSPTPSPSPTPTPTPSPSPTPTPSPTITPIPTHKFIPIIPATTPTSTSRIIPIIRRG